MRAGWLLLSVYMKSIYSAPSGDIVEACEKERASESLEESLFTFYFFHSEELPPKTTTATTIIILL